jgi:hypothetical protein
MVQAKLLLQRAIRAAPHCGDAMQLQTLSGALVATAFVLGHKSEVDRV